MKTEQMIEMKPQHTSFLIKPPDPGARLRRLPLAALTLILVSALSLSGCPGSDSSPQMVQNTPDDIDGDGVLNAADNCPNDFNPNQVNSDDDAMGNACDPDDDNDTILDTMDVDDDGDGLIEIHDLDMLDHMRYKLDGTAYNDGENGDDNTGCPQISVGVSAEVSAGVSPEVSPEVSAGVSPEAGSGSSCSGYELGRNLDFSAADSYADNIINAAWRPNANADATSAEVEPEDGVNPGWMPIGNNSDRSDNTRFTATFEGNGNTISGLYVRVAPDVGNAYAGLFGYLDTSAVLRNTGVVTAAVFASASGTAYAGGLVGQNFGSISNSYATGSVSASSTSSNARAGGLVGINSGSISNSYATGSASASASSSADAGGLVGVNSSGRISNSYATGSVSASSSTSFAYAGGLVGFNNAGRISNSYATGSVSASSSTSFAYAGGLVGVNGSSGSISNAYATGSASASSAVTAGAGGLVGQNSARSISISNSYWDSGTVVLIEDGAIVTAEDQDIGDDGDHPDVTALTSEQLQATSGTYPDMLGADFDLGSASEYPLLEYGGTEGTDCVSADDSSDLAVCGTLLPEQAVRMASGFLRFSNTTIGRPSSTDFVFFYDIEDEDTATSIAISGTEVNGTTAGSYAIEDASGTALAGYSFSPTSNNSTITLPTLSAGDEFYLRVTFTKGSDSFMQRYRFKK